MNQKTTTALSALWFSGSFFRKLLNVANNFVGTKTPCANTDRSRGSVHDRTDLSDIGFPLPARSPDGMADIVPENGRLVTNRTSCHLLYTSPCPVRKPIMVILHS